MMLFIESFKFLILKINGTSKGRLITKLSYNMEQ